MTCRLGWIAALLLLPGAAGAVRVEGFATGVIDSALTAGEGVDVFGLEGSELSGSSFRIDFAYDTELAPPDSDSNPERSEFDSVDPAHAWLEMAMTVNGRTHVLGGNHRLMEVLDISAFDHLTLHIDSDFESDDGRIVRVEAIGLAEYFEPEAFANDALPLGFPNPNGLQTINGVYFLIDDVDFGPSGEVLHHRSVTFQATLHEITAQVVVPEPGTGLLLAAGLALLAIRIHARGA